MHDEEVKLKNIEDMAKCTKCGSELKDGQKFCTKCGTPVSATPQPMKTVMPQVPRPVQPQAPRPVQPQAPRPVQPQAPRPVQPQAPRPVQPQAPRPVQPQAPQPVQPQAPQQPTNETDEKGFFSRVGAGIASAVTGGSFTQGYVRQRTQENANETLIQGVPMKLEDAQKTFAQLKKKYPDAIDSTDEIEFQQLVDAAKNAANDQSGNIAQQNGRIRKALAALDKKLYELKVKADPNLVGTPSNNDAPARQHHLTTAELHDINPDELAVVEHKATWGIQRGQIARRITERELDAVDGLNGVIIQQGCSAMIFVNGELVKVMDAGAYKLQVHSDAEMKKMIEELTNQLMLNHKDKLKTAEEAERERSQNRSIAERGGLVGIAGSWVRRGLQFVFGATPVAKKNDKDRELEAMKRFKAEAEKIVKEENKQPLLSIILVSNRFFNLTFGGVESEDGIAFNPYVIPMGFLDVNVGVEVEMKISNISDFATNYLTDRNSLTTNDVFKLLNFDIENVIRQELRNQEYTQQGLDANARTSLAQKIQASINRRLYGMECTQILNITDSQDDVFGRFRQVEKEIYCSEKELDYMSRTGEIRNRMEQEQNRQLLNSAQNAADYNQAMLQIDKQGLLTEDERAEFVVMLETQRMVREATTKEEAYEKLMALEGNRLVKEDELEAIRDAIEHDKISRAEITNIMRIQSNRNVEMERQQAEWALDDSRQDHDWEREDLERKRSWGIEDEEREREWIQEEREYDRQQGRQRAEDDYNFEKMLRQRNLDIEDHARERAERLEDEDRAYERQRQQMFDQDQLDANASQRQMQNLEMAMKLQMQQDAQEHQHEENIVKMQTTRDIEVEKAGKENALEQAEFFRQQQRKAEMDAKERETNARTDRNADLDRMERLMDKMGDKMVGLSQNLMGAQRQQTEEYRQQAQHAQQRQDHAQDQAFSAMGGVATAAAGNLHTSTTQTNVSVSQQSQPEVQPAPAVEPMEFECYQCHQIIRVAPGTPQCPLCGAAFAWE